MATLWIAVGSALAAPTKALVTLDGSGSYVDYAADARGTFRPLSLGLVAELVGTDGLAGIGSVAPAGSVPGVPPTTSEAPPSSGPPSGPPGVDPAPSPGPSPPADPGRGEEPITIRTEVREAPLLRVRLTASTATASRNEVYSYTIRVENVGTAPATSTRLTSHVPQHTTYAGSGACHNQPVSVEGNVCVNTDPVVGPGDPHPDEHIEFVLGTLGPGEVAYRTFAVKVKATAPTGYVIYNHAHAEAAGVATVRDADAGVRVL